MSHIACKTLITKTQWYFCDLDKCILDKEQCESEIHITAKKILIKESYVCSVCNHINYGIHLNTFLIIYMFVSKFSNNVYLVYLNLIRLNERIV
jgi:hypothetical protein